MRVVSFLTALFVVYGCAGAPSGKGESTESKKIEDAKAAASAQLYSPNCPPPAHLNPENCGLIVANFPPEEMDAFVAGSCAGEKDKACDEKIDAMIAKKWEARYRKADKKHLREWCAAKPAECKDSSQFEALMLKSHNEAVLAELKAKAIKIRREAKGKKADLNRGGFFYSPPPNGGFSPATQHFHHHQ